jgi:hypothetical protein
MDINPLYIAALIPATRKGAYLIAILMIAFTSCIDDIDLNLDPEQYSRLVVNGLVTDADSVQTVILTRTIPYDRHEPNPPATDAVVSIEADGETWLLEEVRPGYYETRGFKGEVGKTYTLEIIYEDRTYTATSTMLRGFEIDSVGFKIFPWGRPAHVPHYEILVYGQDPPEPDDFFLFKYSVNGVWADTLYRWSIWADIFSNGEYLKGESIGIIESTADSLEIQVVSMSVSENYAFFVNDAIFNYMPNMFFSPPKANVQGNINNGGLGYFLTSSVSYSEKTTLYRRDYETGSAGFAREKSLTGSVYRDP